MPTKAQLIAKHESDCIALQQIISKQETKLAQQFTIIESLKADHKALLQLAKDNQTRDLDALNYEERIKKLTLELSKCIIQINTLKDVIKSIAKG